MENFQKTYFITGATGFLGSNLVRALLKLNNRVFCLRRQSSKIFRVNDISNEINWINNESLDPINLFSKINFDGVIHCATDYGRKIVDPLQTIEANLILPIKLLHAAASNGIPVFVNTDTILDKLINNYSLSKSQFADWLNSYSDKICGINIVLEHFYGFGDDDTKFTTFVIKSLISQVNILPLTQGYQERDFIYIDDVISAIIIILKTSQSLGNGAYRFEIGTGKSISIREFVSLVKLLTSNSTTVIDYGVLPYRKGEIMQANIDNSRILELGWSPKFDIREGLRRTIELELFKGVL
jgi:CDP-paratose synthetase